MDTCMHLSICIDLYMHIYVRIIDSLCCISEFHISNQLYPSKHYKQKTNKQNLGSALTLQPLWLSLGHSSSYWLGTHLHPAPPRPCRAGTRQARSLPSCTCISVGKAGNAPGPKAIKALVSEYRESPEENRCEAKCREGPKHHWLEAEHVGRNVRGMYRTHRSLHTFLWHEIEDAHK